MLIFFLLLFSFCTTGKSINEHKRFVFIRTFAHYWASCLPDATGSGVLSGVCVATPVLPSGRRCRWPAGRAGQGHRSGQIGKAAGYQDEEKTWLKVRA